MNIDDLIRELNHLKKRNKGASVSFITDNDTVIPITKIGVGFIDDEFPPKLSSDILTQRELTEEHSNFIPLILIG